MNLFRWTTKHYQVESMVIGLRISDAYVQCSAIDASGVDVTCTIPTSRIQTCLMDMLHTSLSLRVDNILLEGSLSWYTIEESTYHMGISIARKDRPAWRKIMQERSRRLLHASARPASV